MEGYVVSSPVLAVTSALVVAFFLSIVLPRKRLRLPPGPTGLSFLSIPFTEASSKLDWPDLPVQWAKKYGDIYMFSLPGIKFVVINEFSLAQEVFLNEDVHVRPPIPLFIRALNRARSSPKGLGIVFVDDAKPWKELRGILRNHLRNVKRKDMNFETLVTSHAERLVRKVNERAGSYFDPREYIYVTVANVISSIVSSKTYEYEQDEFRDLHRLIQDVTKYASLEFLKFYIPVLSLLPSSRKNDKKFEGGVEKIFDCISRDIDRCRQSYKPTGENKPTNLVEAFLEKQQCQQNKGEAETPFDDDANLKHLILDLYMAGFEPATTHLAWYFLFMAQHPDVQAKVQAELDEVVGRNRMPNIGDRSTTPFTQATLSECFRRSTMLPITFPNRVKRSFSARGFDVPEGSFVLMNLAWMSLSPGIWDDPMEFRPERFLDEDGKHNTKLDAKLAQFGIGRRSCVGQQMARTEMYIFATYILHRFTLRLPEGTPISFAGENLLTYRPLPYKIQAIPRD